MSEKSSPSREATYSRPLSSVDARGTTQAPSQSFVPSPGIASTIRISGPVPLSTPAARASSAKSVSRNQRSGRVNENRGRPSWL